MPARDFFTCPRAGKTLLIQNSMEWGKSTTDLSTAVVSGSIPGGVAGLWDKKLDVMKPIRLDVDWCIGLQYTYKGSSFVILSVYTPYEYCENEQTDYRLAFLSMLLYKIIIHPAYMLLGI